MLDAINKHYEEQLSGYGSDDYTNEAINIIKNKLNRDDVDIYFFVGGTITNLTAISVLKPYEAIICPDTAHINVHECGAIARTGHTLITYPNIDGKIDIDNLENIIEGYSDFHMVKPKMIYISNSTEYGTIYYKNDLIKLREICDKYGLYLYVDGARLSQALTAKSNDLTLEDMAKYSDIFYIGGTKNGTLCGEALVIVNEDLKADFKYLMKQNGAILAKGYLLGLQFIELFKDDLYLNLANKANTMADKLRAILKKHNIKFYLENDTNQIFVEVNISIYNKLKDEVLFEVFGTNKDNYILRFVTSFQTKEKDIITIDNILSKLV